LRRVYLLAGLALLWAAPAHAGNVTYSFDAVVTSVVDPFGFGPVHMNDQLTGVVQYNSSAAPFYPFAPDHSAAFYAPVQGLTSLFDHNAGMSVAVATGPGSLYIAAADSLNNGYVIVHNEDAFTHTDFQLAVNAPPLLTADLTTLALDQLTFNNATLQYQGFYQGPDHQHVPFAFTAGFAAFTRTSTTPEPASLTLLCLGGFGVLGLRRRKRLVAA
jgi:hypothetical protein